MRELARGKREGGDDDEDGGIRINGDVVTQCAGQRQWYLQAVRQRPQ